MADIYLVRHGETEWSASGQHTSVTDLELTEKGVAQVKGLRGHLDPGSFDLVLSSPRRRALQTLELAGFDRDRVEVTEDLAEWAYGEYEGVTSKEIRKTVPGWTVWTHPTPGGETAGHVRARKERVISRIRESGAERTICFGHGHGLRALALTWLGLDFRHGDQFPLETGTVSVLTDYKDGQALHRWNAAPAGEAY